MKHKEKKEAIALRKEGYSINEIYPTLGVSKGSVSLWVRDVVLTDAQKRALNKKGFSKEAIEKRRETRLRREHKKRQKVIDTARKMIRSVKRRNLFFIGVSLYWAEGSKSKRGNVEFSNSDPRMIQTMMCFFRVVCGVPKEKFRGHVYLHPHLNRAKAETFWSTISGIPRNQFFKTSQQHNRASKNKKDSLPNGTFSINIGSTELFLKIQGWIESLAEQTQQQEE